MRPASFTSTRRVLGIGIGIGVIVALALPSLLRFAAAHEPIRTRFEFHADVSPILRERCASCHSGDDPAAPMPLVSYRDVRPWAYSLEEHVLAESMPPFVAEAIGVELAGGRPLTARELDVLVDWANGGAPEGDPAMSTGRTAGESSPSPPSDPAPAGREAADPPRRTRLASARVRLAEATDARTTEEQVPLDPDLGTLVGWSFEASPRAMVRAVEVDLLRAAGDTLPLGTALGGEDGLRLPDDSGIALSPGARLRVRVHWRKPWTHTGKTASGRVAPIALTRPDPPARTLRAVVLSADAPAPLPPDARLIALRPHTPGRLETSTAGGAAGEPLLDVLHARPAWPLTYRLSRPHVVAADESLRFRRLRDEHPAPAATALITTPARRPRRSPPRRRRSRRAPPGPSARATPGAARARRPRRP